MRNSLSFKLTGKVKDGEALYDLYVDGQRLAHNIPFGRVVDLIADEEATAPELIARAEREWPIN